MTSSTKRACLAQNMNVQETAYLEALTKVSAYEVSGDHLVLRDAAGTTLLPFEGRGVHPLLPLAPRLAGRGMLGTCAQQFPRVYNFRQVKLEHQVPGWV